MVGLDETELAGCDGDAGLAPAVDGVDGGGFGRGADRDAKVDVAQVAHRAGEFQFAGLVAEGFRVMQELGAGGVPACAAVVVRGYQLLKPMKSTASITSAASASRNQIDSRRSLPRARIHAARAESVSLSSTMTVSTNRCLPARKSWPPDFGAVIAAAAINFATCRTVSPRRLS